MNQVGRIFSRELYLNNVYSSEINITNNKRWKAKQQPKNLLACNMYFLHDKHAILRASGVLSLTSNTFLRLQTEMQKTVQNAGMSKSISDADNL